MIKLLLSGLSLFICTLLPITSLHADSNYKGLTQDQAEGGAYDSNIENGLENLSNFNTNNFNTFETNAVGSE